MEEEKTTGLAPPLTPHPSNHGPQPASGPRLHGGEASIERIAQLLGLEDAPEEWRVRFVAWYDDHLLVLLGPKGAPTLVLMVSEASSEKPAWVKTARLAITYKGTGEIPALVDALVRGNAPNRMGSLGAKDLLRLIEDDPDARPLPEIPTTTGQEVSNLLTTWAGPDAYAEFFAVGEVQRSQLDSVDLSGAFRFVQHCETECLMQAPHGIAPLVSAVEYPWDNRTRGLDLGLEVPRMDPQADGMMTTELTEKDVIFGNPKRLKEVLDQVVAAPNPDEKIIFFSNTCVPMVVGEDVESVVRQYARRSEVPLVYLTVTPKSMYNVFRELLHDRRKQSEAVAGPADPAAINLIGFPEGPLTTGLHDLLAGAGIRVNTHLIPSFSVARILALPKAALNVLYPNRVWFNHYAHLTEDSRTPSVSPMAPYGFEGTRSWLNEIGHALGREAATERFFEAAAGKVREEWEAACREARGHGVILVVRAQETAHLSDPSTTWGIPLLRVLQEAGFSVEVLLKVSDRREAREAAEEVRSAALDPEALVVRAFNSFETMRRRLRESPADAVLSYHYFDWRVTEAGKNRFSLQVFEMGLNGAVRTVQRLVGICRTPFYRRYQKFLRRRMDGIIENPRPGGADGAV